ncbi:Filamentous haemagglutinin FhaB/tRNA nuclease CdiA-like TPS domain-containing protein [Tumidithrix helvetica PCC 7403]|uniref:DUF4347 domain-containing protein n=1 Tax=Tumidithrix helvetica TaxID=3457545 RepID=UPI003CA9515C
MKLSLEIYRIPAAIAIAIFSGQFIAGSISAQVITPAQDGTGTVVLTNGQRFDITGGTQAGANLFHSFQQFGLDRGQIANFLSQPNIQNILSRVVGGDPSVINGLIQLTGGNSNLYIINPAGIIFGANASLNVPAAFTATTANGIQVGNGWFGMSTSASDLKNLTGTPNAFAFTNPSAPLSQGQTTGVILNQGNLSTPQGQSITLVGGIVINTGTISTPNGKINIVAVPDGKFVRITPEGGVLSLDLPIAAQQELGTSQAITAIDLPKLLTGTGITAPTQTGTSVINGQVFANSGQISILADRYDTSRASLSAANIQQGWNFVFVDGTIANYQTLIDGTKGGSSLTLVNPDQNGIHKITTTLANVTGANSLHIVSEGDSGNFWLGRDFVSHENIARYSSDLQAWRTALSPAANILLYACNLANGDNGAALVQAVKTLTGHEIAASSNRTGSTALGGDWNLEYQTGGQPATVIFSNATTQAYKETLAILTVLNTNDAGANSLRGQIASAIAGDTIRFDTTGTFATPQTIALTTGELGITKNLSIQGTGAGNLTISGNNASRVFNISGAIAVNIDGMTVANGRVSSTQGAGILVNTGATLNLTNSVIANNTIVTANSGSDGAGLANNGTATLTNVTLRNNTAADDGGGIKNAGLLTISNSTISNNTAIGTSGTSGGGGIINVTSGTLNLNNTIVSGNNARVGGGLRNDGTVTIDGVTFSGNTASSFGGAIARTNNSTLAIANSILSGNTAQTGGGFFGIGAVTLTNSTISGNFASNNGGGIANVGAVTLTNSTVSGNSASNNGGGITNIGAITLTNSTVSGNFAGNNGGGIANVGAVTLTNSTVSGNSASNNGGGITNIGAVTLTNSTVSGNFAGNNGGGIFGISNSTITNSTITNNTADADRNGTGDGGGIFRSGGTFTIRNSVVAGNFDRGLQAPDLGSNVVGAGFVNGGNNLIGANDGFAVIFPNSALIGTIANPVDPKLAPLGNYGGTTQTHALLPGSVALDAGNNALAPIGTDQRGATRIFGGTVDIGAFEAQGFSLTPLANTTPQSTNINTSFATLLGVQVTENFVNSPIPAPGILVTFTSLPNGADGSFAGNSSVFTNNLGIAIAPVFTANGIPGSYSVLATANGFKPATFSLTNKTVGGFGGVYPSREDLEGRQPKLDEKDLEDVSEILCLDPVLASAQTTSIPPCK